MIWAINIYVAILFFGLFYFSYKLVEQKIELEDENESLREKLSALENAMDEEFVFPNDVALERKNKIEVEENEKTESRIS